MSWLASYLGAPGSKVCSTRSKCLGVGAGVWGAAGGGAPAPEACAPPRSVETKMSAGRSARAATPNLSHGEGTDRFMAYPFRRLNAGDDECAPRSEKTVA